MYLSYQSIAEQYGQGHKGNKHFSFLAPLNCGSDDPPVQWFTS